jgi:hypothetical protein
VGDLGNIENAMIKKNPRGIFLKTLFKPRDFFLESVGSIVQGDVWRII